RQRIKSGFQEQQAPPCPRLEKAGEERSQPWGAIPPPAGRFPHSAHPPLLPHTPRRLLPSGETVWNWEQRRREGGEAAGKSWQLWKNLPGSSCGPLRPLLGLVRRVASAARLSVGLQVRINLERDSGRTFPDCVVAQRKAPITTQLALGPSSLGECP
ncbi:hypothetical protein MC885_018531, partial [Smutsia gigantea]